MPETQGQHAKVIILGGGPAGYTAAVYAARAMLSPLLVQGPQPGGQMTITTDVENYPGFADVIQGPWLMEQMEAQARHIGTVLVNDTITQVDLTRRPFHLTGDSNNFYTADSLIISTGAQAKWLGVEGEERLRGFGVSACATCDGFFYRDREVIVVGGGNTAVEEALFLTRFASKVYVVHRRDSLRAERILQERLFAHEKVQIIWNHIVEEITGEDSSTGVQGVVLRHVTSGERQTIPVHGVFVAIGHQPSTGLFAGKLLMTENGYLVTKPDSTATTIEGVFAAGDVTDEIYRQAVTAAGAGCMAALDAERFLTTQTG
ncbi:MAG: thioredoxin-disulfide reductase [Parvularculales bacterium]